MSYVRAASLDDLWIGEMRGCSVEGARVLLVRLDDGVRAFDDRCAHLGFPLSQGKLEGDVLTCAAHHYQYDVRTGEGVNPRTCRMRPYPARVEDGQIYVDTSGTSKP